MGKKGSVTRSLPQNSKTANWAESSRKSIKHQEKHNTFVCWPPQNLWQLWSYGVAFGANH